MQVAISKPLTVGDGDNKRTLSKTITVGEGETAKKQEVLELDLEKLTGADMDFCTREAGIAKGEPVRVLAIDLEFHIHVAARAADVEPSVLKKLSAPDYIEVATAVQGFLTGSL